MPRWFLNFALVMLVLSAAFAGELSAAPKSTESQKNKTPTKKLPLPGEVFRVDGCTAFLIPPRQSVAGKTTPWVWYAPTLPGLPADSEKWMFERFTAAGIAIAGIDVGESYGSPQGRAKYTALYQRWSTSGACPRNPCCWGEAVAG